MQGNQISTIIKHALLYALLSLFTIMLVRITVPYFGLDTKTGFLRIKQQYLENKVWLTSFYIHVFTSCFLLIAGYTQFSRRILKSKPSIHRSLGYLYVLTLLLFSAPSGFIMSLYANGGTISRVAFIMLSSLWIISTILALTTALKKDFDGHKKWMTISYALTLSAVTLRLWKYLLANYWPDLGYEPIRPMDLYRIVAWVGWVPNLLIAIYLNTKKATKQII